MTMKLKGKVALVTGAGQGIGRGIALGLAGEGAAIVVSDINLEAARKTAHEIRVMGQRSEALKADVADEEEVASMVTIAINEFDRIDILVNNAGIVRDAMLDKMTDDQWDAVINCHLTGVFNCTQAVVRRMMERKNGRIINIISSAGLVGNIGQANYCTAKAAMIGLTKANARELAPYKITVNAIGPGADTPMTRGVPEKMRAAMLQRIPLGYLAPPDEIAPAAVFLASDDARYITGQVMHVEGGMYM